MNAWFAVPVQSDSRASVTFAVPPSSMSAHIRRPAAFATADTSA
ncbi:hypothetical protein ACFV1L_11200 [Kitasatospora sp. NPDC059646]